MNSNHKEKILHIDVIIQKLFLHWTGSGVGIALIYGFSYLTSLNEIALGILAFSAGTFIFLLLLFLPVLGVFNLIINFFHYKYGSYSDEIKLFRKRHNLASLVFIFFLVIYFTVYLIFSYLIFSENIAFIIAGVVFALSHSYITILENKTRKEIEFNERELLLF